MFTSYNLMTTKGFHFIATPVTRDTLRLTLSQMLQFLVFCEVRSWTTATMNFAQLVGLPVPSTYPQQDVTMSLERFYLKNTKA